MTQYISTTKVACLWRCNNDFSRHLSDLTLQSNMQWEREIETTEKYLNACVCISSMWHCFQLYGIYSAYYILMWNDLFLLYLNDLLMTSPCLIFDLRYISRLGYFHRPSVISSIAYSSLLLHWQLCPYIQNNLDLSYLKSSSPSLPLFLSLSLNPSLFTHK